LFSSPFKEREGRCDDVAQAQGGDVCTAKDSDRIIHDWGLRRNGPWLRDVVDDIY
jgi:hypothetical protein